MATLERAIELAAIAHRGQTDKAGQPYVLHPIRVMLAVQSMDERIAAVLHDVVEDTSWSISALRAQGFSESVLDAIVALTKTEGESRLDAARRAARNPIARSVKLADVNDNMNMDRIPRPTDDDRKRLEGYKRVREVLLVGRET